MRTLSDAYHPYFLPEVMNSNIKHKEECCIRYPNTKKWIEKKKRGRAKLF